MILSMSKMILLNKVSNYNSDNFDSFCFLFLIEKLFEGFIAGVMQETVYPSGGKVILQQSNMSLFEDVVYLNHSLGTAFLMRHDITATLRDKTIILDTRYKEISRFNNDVKKAYSIIKNEPKQTDLYQILEYARKRNIEDVNLLYPMYRYERKEETFPVGTSCSPTLNINVHFIRLPFIFENNDEEIMSDLKDF